MNYDSSESVTGLFDFNNELKSKKIGGGRLVIYYKKELFIPI